MQKIACLVTNNKFKWEELLQQNWQDEQIIIALTNPVFNLGNLNNLPNCTIFSASAELLENLVLEKVTGKYLVFINPQESIQKNFVEDLRNWLDQNYPPDKLLYGLGFVYRNNATIFSPEALPILSKPILIENVIDNFAYLLPWVKYVWQTNLIKEWGLSFNTSITSWMLKQAVFSLDYISSLYKVNGYSQLKSASIPFSYISGFEPSTPFLKTEILTEKIEDKSEIWLASPFSKVALKYRWLRFKKGKEK
jgi:hypothetical protein